MRLTGPIAGMLLLASPPAPAQETRRGHPHVHVLAADGVFGTDEVFVELPPIPEALIECGFRRAVLDFLVEERAISEELRSRMLGWRYSGWYSNRSRGGARTAKTAARATAPSAVVEVLSEFAQRAKAAWARCAN